MAGPAPAPAHRTAHAQHSKAKQSSPQGHPHPRPHLLASLQGGHEPVVGEPVHHVVPLHALLLGHAEERRVEGHGAVLGPEEEQARRGVHL